MLGGGGERLYNCNVANLLQLEAIPRLCHLEYGQFSDGVVEESTFSGATTLSENSYDRHCVQVVGYASIKNEHLFLQAIDKGMYDADKSDKMGLPPDDDDKLGFSADDDDVGDDSVVVVDIDVDLLMSNLKNGVITPVGCNYTSKLAFICSSPVSEFYSPIPSTE